MQMEKTLRIIYLYILFLAFAIVDSYEREVIKFLKGFQVKTRTSLHVNITASHRCGYHFSVGLGNIKCFPHIPGRILRQNLILAAVEIF